MYDCYSCAPTYQRAYIKTREDEPAHFTVYNSRQAVLTFAALDNCLFKSHDIPRCDLVIGSFEKLYLVEIKQVNKNKRHTARRNAVEQLSRTLAFLIGQLNLHATTLIAVICLKAQTLYPAFTAAKAAQIVRFREQFNASLVEGNSIEY